MVAKASSIPESPIEQLQYAEILKQNLETKQKELELIMGKIHVYKTQLVSLENRLTNMQSEFNANMLQQKQAFECEKQKKIAELDNRFDILNRAEVEITKRKMALEEQEQVLQEARKERDKLFAEKIKYEKLNTEANGRFDEANKMFDEASLRINQAAEKELKVQKQVEEVKLLKTQIDIAKEKIEDLNAENKQQIENLLSIRDDLNPKLAQYEKLVAINTAKLEAIKHGQEDINAKLDEDNRLFDIIKQKEAALKQKEIEVTTKEEDLKRRELLNEHKTV